MKNTILAGKYEMLKEINHGNMSVVYLARDINLNKVWAVKAVNKESPEYQTQVNEGATLKDVKIMKNLDHPSLPRIVDIIDTPKTLYVVMDYVEGETFLSVMKKYGPQDEEVVAAWMIELCEVIGYLHSLNPPIIFKDIKPSNIILKPEGTIKLIDFGIAREYKAGKEDTTCLGTPGYASPEHFTKKTDTRSDIYSIGATMFYLLTGDSPAEKMYNLPSIRNVNEKLSTGLEKIVKKATEYEPEDRYQTVKEMQEDLLNYKKLEEPYLAKLRKTHKIKNLLIALSIVFFLLGSGLLILDKNIKANTYESLLTRESINQEERVDSLKKAIELRPDKPEGYLKLIDTYANDGTFTELEATEFMSIYNQGKELISKNENYAKLNYEIGKAFLLRYSGGSDNSDRNKLITSLPFFEEAGKIEFENQKICKDYCNLANFYRDYMMHSKTSLLDNDMSYEDYLTLLDSMESIAEELSKEEGKDNLKNATSKIIFSIISSERKNMLNAGVAEFFLVEKVESISNLTAAPQDELIAQIKSMYETERRKNIG